MISIRFPLVLALITASVLNQADSSCPYDVQECKCSSTSMSCSNLQTLPQLNNKSDVNTVESLLITGGKINSINDAILPPGLTYIQFVDLPLKNISDNAFLSSANTLKTLWIWGASFDKLPTALLELTSLTDFSLGDTYFEFWDTTILQHLAKTVTSLSLSNVGLTSWPSWFSFFHSMTRVYFYKNVISSIPDDAFLTSQDTLTFLGLGSAGLIRVPKALSVLKNLKHLELIENNMINADGRPEIEQLTLFPCVNTLRTLHIESTGLTIAPNFSSMAALEEVYFHSNLLTNLPLGSLPLSITTLEFFGNYFTSVPAIISTLPKLSHLDLSYNKISEISFDMFPASLTYLQLGLNRIITIKETVSANISALQTLHLEFDPITNIPSPVFKNLAKLEYLYLSNTQMTQIPLGLTYLTRLKQLSLSSISTLSCPCPPPVELTQWYKALDGTINQDLGTCNNGQSIHDYLSNSCKI